MLLLHLSDIHFRYPHCVGPHDAERPFRNALIQDLREMVARLGPVTAISLTGDVAFQGGGPEYTAARNWLTELCDAAQASPERIFVVPGNHDVDRDVIKNNVSIRNAQAAIKGARAERRERELRDQLNDENIGGALFAPLAMYNDFAAKFGCQVYREKTYWQQEVDLEHGVKIRFFGLTSTLLSGMGGGDDNPRDLYLSPLQTVLDSTAGVINLVMCHHPPDWFEDQDQVEDAIRGRAQVHLFGHKHRQRIVRDPGFVQFSAGAVNPDRNEPQWSPGYNLIELRVAPGERWYLDMRCHLREWQENPQMFRAKLERDGTDVFLHRIEFRRPRESPVTSGSQRGVQAPVEQVETGMKDEETRHLILRFWNIRSSQRRDIALRLKLIEEDDLKLLEPERYGKALAKAGELGVLREVADAIDKAEQTNG